MLLIFRRRSLRSNLCVFCGTDYICAVGGVETEKLASSISTSNSCLLVVCVTPWLSLLLSACGCFLVYRWHPVDLFLTLYVVWHEQENTEEKKQHIRPPHPLTPINPEMRGVQRIHCLVVPACPIRWNRGTVSLRSGVSREQEMHGGTVQSEWTPKCRGLAAVSDTPSIHCCSPQHTDRQATWPLWTSVGRK